MKIAIIGGGLTGLTAAYELGKQGHEVTVFEKEAYLGGLASGFKEKGWDWPLEKTYHHFFTNDDNIINLLKELGLSDKIIIKRPITANFYQGKTFQLDSPHNLLTFPYLNLFDKLRTAVLLAFLKLNPFWQPLESLTARDLLIKVGGQPSWRILWEPLMVGKFGTYSDQVAASWFWARIKKRTPNLGYISGGFQTLINALELAIKKQGGIIRKNTLVPEIKIKSSGFHSTFYIRHSTFDKVLLTIPTPLVNKLINLPPTTYHLPSIPHLHAQTLILETKEPILKDTYWLSITDRTFPFLAVVAHTNFMDPKHYNGHHLTYFGNYLSEGHPYLKMDKKQLLKEFLPFIKHLNPSFNHKLSTINYKLFTAPFAQPIHELHYSKRAPKLVTSIPSLYLANLDSIYPWDRGTNYAVELGQKTAKALLSP